MKPYGNFKARKSAGASMALPAGGYVGKIKTAKEVVYNWGSVLEIAFDVTEGEFTGFFQKQFDSNTAEDKKWKGVCRIVVPKETDEAWQRGPFENLIFSIEESNPGYHWDWNESGLKGKTCGFLFNNREWEMNGNTGWTTECRNAATVDDIREGTFKIPKDRPLKNGTSNSRMTQPNVNANDFSDVDDDGEVPF